MTVNVQDKFKQIAVLISICVIRHLTEVVIPDYDICGPLHELGESLESLAGTVYNEVSTSKDTNLT